MGKSHQGQEKTPSDGHLSERLDSWKEIAAYLQRDVRTVRRWEEKEGLPVLRHMHDKLSTVYAYRSQIDAWLGKRSPTLGWGSEEVTVQGHIVCTYDDVAQVVLCQSGVLRYEESTHGLP